MILKMSLEGQILQNGSESATNARNVTRHQVEV